MYAVIETGGKQYRVSPGETLRVETLAGDKGSAIDLGRVVAVVGDDHKLAGADALAKAKVRATVTGHDRSSKVLVFKFKRKKQYRRTIGHRQNYTEVKIDAIEV